MTKKKNKFWTFIFSLIPGAGEMYMGFMKQGVTLMGAFFLLIFLASWLNTGSLLFVLPVLWCYGFFHVHNLRGMPDEEFYELEDDYLFHLDTVLPKGKNMDKKFKNGLAVVCIVIGGILLLENLGNVVRWCLPNYLMEMYWNVTNMLPQLVIAVMLVMGGIWLIRGKKRELDEQDVQAAGMQQNALEKKDGE